MAADLASLIRTIPDYPKPGIKFRDITTLIRDPEGLNRSVEMLAEAQRGKGFELVAGIEARGFIFGAPLAQALGVGFVPIRKPGKLPGKKLSKSYQLEYGEDEIEMHADAVDPGSRVLIVDDLLATGGTAEAAISLVRSAGGKVDTCTFVVALPELGGIERLQKLDCRVDWLVEFDGE